MNRTLHCFSKKTAAANGYGAAPVWLSLIAGIAMILAGAWIMDDDTKAKLLCVLVGAGFLLFFYALYAANRRSRARLVAYAVNRDGSIDIVQRSGARGVGLFAAGSAAGSISEAVTGHGGELLDTIGTIAGIAAVNRLYHAMSTPEIIETMLDHPEAVHGANLFRVTGVEQEKRRARSARFRCSGINQRTGKPFTGKPFHITFAYTNMETLLTAFHQSITKE